MACRSCKVGEGMCKGSVRLMKAAEAFTIMCMQCYRQNRNLLPTYVLPRVLPGSAKPAAGGALAEPHCACLGNL